MKHVRVGPGAVLLVAAGFIVPLTANASFHFWKFDEVFSNAAGTQQYIEMSDSVNGEQFLFSDGGVQIMSNSHTYTVPHDLPFPGAVGHDTANQHLLFATTGFFPGGLTPDFTLPAGFFSTGADVLHYTSNGDFTYDTMTYSSLPTDGVNSRYQTAGTTSQITGPATPSSFLPEPGSLMLLVVAAGLLGARRR